MSSFPAGTDPIFRERTEHDCQCCRQFIRAVGGVVSIVDGELVSIWDVDTKDDSYNTVAAALSALVKSKTIRNLFLSKESSAGTDKNFQQTDAGLFTWEHFYVKLPLACIRRGDIGEVLNNYKADYDVFYRGLSEITREAIATVLELIGQNSLYRGEEHRAAVALFERQKNLFLAAEDKSLFCWSMVGKLSSAVLRIRNTSIGTLLTDLSEGVEPDKAVASFESKVAPANYKRPSALVTPAMVAKAKQTIEELGLLSALERRYATLDDISINDILFADRSAKRRITSDVFADISEAGIQDVKSFGRVEEITIDTFLSEVLPKAESVEVLVENRHTANLMSLIAPVDGSAKNMFKWPNRFSWSYTGDVADSIKERVKQSGGSVSGDLLCRLAWDNNDDLDLHMIEPGYYQIYYDNKRKNSPNYGVLDVDANGGDGLRLNPVENIVYADRARMKEGVYKLFVHQYNQRERTNVGFTVEIEFQGETHSFHHDKIVRQGERIEVAKIHYSKAGGFKIGNSMPSTQAAKEVWGIYTQKFQRVSVVMNSPNHWDGHTVGNKHYFFMLDGCVNDGKARGFFNEFLSQDLDKHRKVLEMVGAKMRTDEAVDQLSGLGFSSTQRDSLVCKVRGAFARTLKIVF